MLKAISNTSPLLYLYRIGVMGWLPKMFEEVWIPSIEPFIDRLSNTGMWLSDEIRQRILALAGEEPSE